VHSSHFPGCYHEQLERYCNNAILQFSLSHKAIAQWRKVIASKSYCF
jgi:hypothetical protein